MIDLSINFPLDDKIRNNIFQFQNRLLCLDNHLEIVTKFKLHCTVKSCGLLDSQISEDVIPEVITITDKILKNEKSFKVILKGVNTFPGILFINIVSLDKSLEKLHNTLHNRILYSEYPEFEGSGYKPHCTIIEHFKGSKLVENEIEKYKSHSFGEMMVENLEIILGGEGSPREKFNVLETFKLQRQPNIR